MFTFYASSKSYCCCSWGNWISPLERVLNLFVILNEFVANIWEIFYVFSLTIPFHAHLKTSSYLGENNVTNTALDSLAIIQSPDPLCKLNVANKTVD